MSFIVPAGESGGGIALTEEMRRDAAMAATSLSSEGKLPALYLCQSNGDLVKQGKAADKDWIISGVGDDDAAPINFGNAPLFIVLTAQTRYRYSVEDKEEDKQRIIWDAAKGFLTEKQDLDVAEKRGKRYTAFILIHVGEDGIDPFKVGPMVYLAKGMSSLAGIKWSDAVANIALQGVPPYTVAWRMGCKLEKAPQGKGSYNVMTHQGPVYFKVTPEVYAELKKTWQFADAKRKRDEHSGHAAVGVVTEEDHYAAMADTAKGERIIDVPVEDGPADYTAHNDSGYGDEDSYATSLPEPEVPKAAKAQNMDWDTPIRCGKNDAGMWLKKPCCEMSAMEAKVAWDMAAPHTATSKEAAAVHELLTVWANHKGWQIGQPEF